MARIAIAWVPEFVDTGRFMALEPANMGLKHDNPPANWEDVANYSKQIHAKTGKFGFGMVARLNHGNTPFRFAPTMWAHGGGILATARSP